MDGLRVLRLAVVTSIVMSVLASGLAIFVATDSASIGPMVSKAQAQNCEFLFGFATVAELLGPQVVGSCVEDMRPITGNGNFEQRTTNGMLVSSALDGYIRFITDTWVWVWTPDGVYERAPNVRFDWEGDRQLVENLQRGGYIIYFRHGATDNSQTDSDPYNLENCETQRNLNEAGRNQAAMIGMQVRALHIPVGQVWTSPYCRAREFGQLMLGLVDIEPTLVFYEAYPREEWPANIEAFRRVLSAATPPPGANLIMVSHSPNIRDAAQVDLPVEGGAAILSPTPGGPPRLVARVLPTEWATFAELFGAR
jgi:phosphohistidine phosphatase SixA